MAAVRIEEAIAERETLAGWVSGGTPQKSGELIPFPTKQPAEHIVFIDTDSFAMGKHWESIKISLHSIGAGNYDDLVAQEGTDPSENAPDRTSHQHMLPRNGGLHVETNRNPSGFRSWDEYKSK